MIPAVAIALVLVLALLAGADIARAARFVGRVSGDSTVAYQLAFARAVKAPTGTEPPPRAALVAELERIANHNNDVGLVATDAAFALLHTLRPAARAGPARFRRIVRPSADDGSDHPRWRFHRPRKGGIARLGNLVTELGAGFAEIAAAYDNTPSLLDRTVATGTVEGDLAHSFAPGGYVGRASGRLFDSRRTLAYPPYDRLAFEVATLDRGDVDARVRVRIREVGQSLSLVEQILGSLPPGPVLAPVLDSPGEGLAFAEAFRGDVMVWVRLDAKGRVTRCHPRDPSWFQWPLLEAAIEGNIVADFPLCNKSFNCSYAGHDL